MQPASVDRLHMQRQPSLLERYDNPSVVLDHISRSWRQLSCNCHDILNMQPDFRSIDPFGAGTIESRYELSWRVEEKWVIGYPRSVLVSNTGSAGS